ncbi:uncharacterized protein [Haliotis cracherodii]|uniref:uncharacterized protein n=1 Tax=Haliotis cracherodii TaxID=6455 RepID=UPI0039ED1C50
MVAQWKLGGRITRISVHLFGAVSSPSCANFALKETAKDNMDLFGKEVVHAVDKSFYVDDCLTSVQSEKMAIEMSHKLREICKKGGCRLTKCISNSRAAIESIPEEERAKDFDMDDALPIERASGVHWCVESDTFKFRIAIKDKPVTRRGILSTVSSIYEPLGFAGPYVLKAKGILLDLCRLEIGWDDVIPVPLQKDWTKWLSELHRLEEMVIRRCIKPKDSIQKTHILRDIPKKDVHLKKVARVNLIDYSKPCKEIDSLISHYPDWFALKKAIAWVLRIREVLLDRSQKKKAGLVPQQSMPVVLTVKDLENAEKAIVRYFQQQDFSTQRVTPDEPPFTFVGVDYFGPFHVKRGRQYEKRYGVLFTCLTTRAVHKEVAYSLDTDSCINALRRVMARRGQVKVIRSDNGTNFAESERELREELESWNKCQIHQEMLQRNVEWTFNPPAGSHHGGVWERQIRTVRNVLRSLERQKWVKLRRNLKIGDIVLKVDNTAPRNSWSMGKVVKLMPDRKGVVRRVEVKTQTKVLDRLISKLCLLLGSDT